MEGAAKFLLEGCSEVGSSLSSRSQLLLAPLKFVRTVTLTKKICAGQFFDLLIVRSSREDVCGSNDVKILVFSRAEHDSCSGEAQPFFMSLVYFAETKQVVRLLKFA